MERKLFTILAVAALVGCSTPSPPEDPPPEEAGVDPEEGGAPETEPEGSEGDDPEEPLRNRASTVTTTRRPATRLRTHLPLIP